MLFQHKHSVNIHHVFFMLLRASFKQPCNQMQRKKNLEWSFPTDWSLTVYLNLHKCVCFYLCAAMCERYMCGLLCVKSAAVMLCDPCGCRWRILASFALVYLCDMAIYSASSSAQAVQSVHLLRLYAFPVICVSLLLSCPLCSSAQALYIRSVLNEVHLALWIKSSKAPGSCGRGRGFWCGDCWLCCLSAWDFI